MSMPWYEWRNIRNRLLGYARAVQGVSPYRVALEPDRTKCPSGYTSFSRRLIMVNPAMFKARPGEQYRLTKALLCHEAGHRRFTTPARLPRHVHLVSNMLEDERIERLMEEEFAGVRGLLRELSAAMLAEARMLDAGSNDPAQVLGYLLQLRWSLRSGLPVRGALSPANLERWALVEPLAREAWAAASSEVCDRNAAEILRLLRIREPEIPAWLRALIERLEAIEGERGTADPPEAAAPSGAPLPIEEGKGDIPFDGEPLPHEHGAGGGTHVIEPKPYLALMGRVRPLVRRLVEALSVDETEPASEPADRGGRLVIRQYLRDRDRPFAAPEVERPAPPTLAFRVVIDHSTSMNHDGRMEHAAQAAMLLHLAGLELGVPHQIVVTPGDIRLADLESGERGLALIAGMVPAQTNWEDTGRAVSTHGSELTATPEEIKLLLVIHDGMGNDHELLARACRRLRDKVLILGVGIGMGESEAGLLREQFGADRYIHCASAEELPAKVGAVLRAVRGR